VVAAEPLTEGALAVVPQEGEKQSAREVHGFDPADMEPNGSFPVMIHSYEAK